VVVEEEDPDRHDTILAAAGAAWGRGAPDLVGVDGPPGSDAALRWAGAHAPAFGAGLVAVHCWSPPLVGDEDELTGAHAVALERDFGAVLDAAVDRTTVGVRDVPVERVLSRGDPAQVLTELAAGAELLVLGSRGTSGHTGLVLGSVSRRCTDRAPCPVVIVPTP
jgi:nucleotide-binding universal stress UspA family protein